MLDTSFWAADIGRLATAYVPTPQRLKIWDTPEGQWSRPQAFGDGVRIWYRQPATDLLVFGRAGGSVRPS